MMTGVGFVSCTGSKFHVDGP